MVIPIRVGDSGMENLSRRRDWQHEPMAITTSSIAHVRLTVTDIERSRQFYERVRLAGVDQAITRQRRRGDP
jgi:catechol-2,3-dioxygenase